MNYLTIFRSFIFGVFLILSTGSFNSYGQNTTITDSAIYNAHSSAILDVQSTSKGFLVPRMTSSQRIDIINPSEGLLVFDTDLSEFYVYKKSTWESIAASPLWMSKDDSVFVTGDGVRLGVGTSSPAGRFIIQGDSTAKDEPLFEVKNSTGQSIFAVYEDSVAINFVESGKGVKGGFAVGGLSPGKNTPRDYLRITPDSVRIYVDTSSAKGAKGGFAVGGLTPGKSGAIDLMRVTSDSVRVYINDLSSKGAKGGFAVGGLTPGKSSANQYFQINPDSARIYVKDQAKGAKGGFAVGGLTPGKGITGKYLTIEKDSARIYIDNSSKGAKGGFAVGGLTPGKGSSVSFLNLTPLNYFIGDSAGMNTQPNVAVPEGVYNQFIGYNAGHYNTTGKYNSFNGYEAGYHNTSGYQNYFAGYQAGYSNTIANKNVAVGPLAGYSNMEGQLNVFVGTSAGRYGTDIEADVFVGTAAGMDNNRYYNTFVGYQAGMHNETGTRCTFLGIEAGRWSEGGTYNIFIGRRAGHNAQGDNNVYIGADAGAWPNQNDEDEYNDCSNNVFVGNYSGRLLQSGDGNIFLGYYAGGSVSSASNKLYIDNSSTSTPLIYGDFTDGSEALRFNGKVGIDMAATEKLDVNGAVRIGTTANSNSGTIRWTGTDFEGYDGSSWLSLTASGAGADSDWTISVDDMYSAVSGNVGIGYTSPSYKLDVNGSARVDGNFYITSGDTYSKLDFGYETGGYSYMTIYDGSSQDDIQLATNSDSWFNHNGNFGIGTKTPSTKLEVNGDISVHDDDWVGIGTSDEKISFDADQDQIEIVNAMVGVETTNPTSGLHVNTSFAKNIQFISSDTNLDATHNVVCSDTPKNGKAGITAYLPDPSTCVGRQYTIKHVGMSIVVDGNGKAIDGYSYINLDDQYEYVTIISDGNQWLIISQQYN